MNMNLISAMSVMSPTTSLVLFVPAVLFLLGFFLRRLMLAVIFSAVYLIFGFWNPFRLSFSELFLVSGLFVTVFSVVILLLKVIGNKKKDKQDG